MNHFKLLIAVAFLAFPFISSAQIEDVIYDQIFERKYKIVPYSMIKEYKIKGLEYYYKEFSHFELAEDSQGKKIRQNIFYYKQYCETFDSLGLLIHYASCNCMDIKEHKIAQYNKETVKLLDWIANPKVTPSTSSLLWWQDSIAKSMVYYDRKRKQLFHYSQSNFFGWEPYEYMKNDSILSDWIAPVSSPMIYFLDDNFQLVRDSFATKREQIGCIKFPIEKKYYYHLIGSQLKIERTKDDVGTECCYTYDAQNRLHQIWYNGCIAFTFLYEKNRLQRVVDNRGGDKIFIEVLY